ncbi:MAG: hypothetical protein NVS1B4_05740 [Gemmatimonadaceae bacterium]
MTEVRRTRCAVAGLLIIVAATAACHEAKQPPIAGRSPLADSADQVMFGARELLTNEGVKQAELFADTGFFFDDNTRIELRTVRTTFYTATGVKNATLTSREGTYNTRAGQMDARGDVVVVSEDGRRLVTPQLRYTQPTNEIASDSAFTLTEPGRRLQGIGFRSDPQMKNIRVLKTVAGSTGTMTIPNQ